MPTGRAELPAARRAAIAAPLDAQRGYDRAAAGFDDWRWSQLWRQYEAPWVHAWIRRLHGAYALDVGCGTGNHLAALADAVPQTVGVDLSGAMLARARTRAPTAWLAQARVEALPLATGCVDAVLAARVLSHVADPARALAEIARVSRHGAAVLITDVHPDHPYAHTRLPTADGEVAIETYHHRIDTLRRAARAAGLRIQAQREFRRSQLVPAPDRVAFAKLYRGDVPVFHLLKATRAARLHVVTRAVHRAAVELA